MSGERQPRERVLAAFNEEPRSSRSADFLASRAKRSPHDAYARCSIAVSFRVTQVVDIVRGGNAMIPKSQFSGAVLIMLPPLAKAGSTPNYIAVLCYNNNYLNGFNKK
jgi:hypothetical protein